jgi:hypothetical protein
MYGTLPFTGGLNLLRLLFILVALVVFIAAAIRKQLSRD